MLVGSSSSSIRAVEATKPASASQVFLTAGERAGQLLRLDRWWARAQLEARAGPVRRH